MGYLDGHEFLDGPMLVAWLEQEHRLPDRLPETTARRLWEWRHGARATIWSADRHLTVLGVHLTEVPDEIWQARKSAPRQRVAA